MAAKGTRRFRPMICPTVSASNSATGAARSNRWAAFCTVVKWGTVANSMARHQSAASCSVEKGGRRAYRCSVT